MPTIPYHSLPGHPVWSPPPGLGSSSHRPVKLDGTAGSSSLSMMEGFRRFRRPTIPNVRSDTSETSPLEGDGGGKVALLGVRNEMDALREREGFG